MENAYDWSTLPGTASPAIAGPLRHFRVRRRCELLWRGGRCLAALQAEQGHVQNDIASAWPLGGIVTHWIHVWYICQHLHQYTPNVSIYIPYMDPMGYMWLYDF